jgi:hypothetical protein
VLVQKLSGLGFALDNTVAEASHLVFRKNGGLIKTNSRLA